MPRIWKIHDGYPESLIGEYLSVSGPDRFLLRQGKPLSDAGAEWTFRFNGSVERLRRFDDLANNTMAPLVSPRLVSLLAELAGDDIEFLPSKIYAKGDEIADYRLLNAVSSVEAVDFVESEPVFIPGTDAVMKFNRLRLKESCLGSRLIARCEEYRSYLIVADRLAQAVENSAMTGMSLKRPEDIRP
jgi:hypothetical protein